MDIYQIDGSYLNIGAIFKYLRVSEVEWGKSWIEISGYEAELGESV